MAQTGVIKSAFAVGNSHDPFVELLLGKFFLVVYSEIVEGGNVCRDEAGAVASVDDFGYVKGTEGDRVFIFHIEIGCKLYGAEKDQPGNHNSQQKEVRNKFYYRINNNAADNKPCRINSGHGGKLGCGFFLFNDLFEKYVHMLLHSAENRPKKIKNIFEKNLF